MWTYGQSSTLLTSPAGIHYTGQYAGRGEGLNNPILQDVHAGTRWNVESGLWEPVDGLTANDWGPLPCGLYTIQEPEDTTTHGPYVLWLIPDPANKMFGRGGFGIHGDNKDAIGQFIASEGCIVTPPATRHVIGTYLSKDNQLQVVSD